MSKAPIPFAFAAIALIAAAAPACADGVEDFYRGKRITLSIGSSAGGGTDLYGRLVARFIGSHIPGHPAVLPFNVPGAVGLVTANALYNTAPRDEVRSEPAQLDRQH